MPIPEVFKDVKRAVVVTAHADDLETVLGGTVAMLVQAGVQVMEVICTRGDIGTHDPAYTRETLAAARRQEAEEAGRILGVQEVVVLDHPDGELQPTLDLRAEIARYYRRFQPDTLFTFDAHWSGQAHPDHTAAGRAALDAYMPSKMPLYHPEQLAEGAQVTDIKNVFLFGGTVPEEIVIDVGQYWPLKVQATLAHRSQFKSEENLQWLTEMTTEVGKRGGFQYGEAFHKMDVW